jgi:hypothetical protein
VISVGPSGFTHGIPQYTLLVETELTSQGKLVALPIGWDLLLRQRNRCQKKRKIHKAPDRRHECPPKTKQL